MLEPRTFRVAQSGCPGDSSLPGRAPSTPRCCVAAGAALALASSAFRHARASLTMAGLGPSLPMPETPSVGSTSNLAARGGASRISVRHTRCTTRPVSSAPVSQRPPSGWPARGAATSSSTPRGAIRRETPLTDFCDRSRNEIACTRTDGRLPTLTPWIETHVAAVRRDEPAERNRVAGTLTVCATSFGRSASRRRESTRTTGTDRSW